MKNKLFISSLGFILLVGCNAAPSKSYTPKDGNSNWAITGRYNGITRNIQVLFDGNKVLEGRMSLIFGNSAKMDGTYKGHNIKSECAITKGILRDTLFCIVSVDNEVATKLDFEYY